MNFRKPHNRILALALALVLFGCLASQASASFSNMESMGCDTQMMCGACSYLLGAGTTNLTFYFPESEYSSHLLPPSPDTFQEPLYHPPR